MVPIYLDNAATTPVLPQVREAIDRALTYAYGNPSSLHQMGVEAEEIVRNTRRALAVMLGVPERGIYFTSGGTEADNLAILGAARHYQRRGRHIVISAVEHAAVSAPCAALEKAGWKITRVGVDSTGRVSPQDVAAAVTDETVLVSVMTVNNEVGTIQPIADIAAAVKAVNPKCLVHTDAVQALGKVELRPLLAGVDMVSVSAHKLHGPKGCGALWVRQGVQLEPLVYGGGQENGWRSGTENVPGIAGFGAAIAAASAEGEQGRQRMAELRATLIRLVRANTPEAVLNGPETDQAAPHICNFSIPGLKGEVLVHALAHEGVFVSTGAACSSRHQQHASHVLQAMGASAAAMTGSLRFSLSSLTTADEVEYAASALARVVKLLSAGKWM